MNQHQPYCDHDHTPRQRCNRARAVGPAASECTIDVPRHAEPVSGPPPNGNGASSAPVDDGPLDLVRDTIATTDAPRPMKYVTREWDKTAGAVEQAYRGTGNGSPRPTRRTGPIPAVAFLAAAIGLFLLLRSMTRRQPES